MLTNATLTTGRKVRLGQKNLDPENTALKSWQEKTASLPLWVTYEQTDDTVSMQLGVGSYDTTAPPLWSYQDSNEPHNNISSVAFGTWKSHVIYTDAKVEPLNATTPTQERESASSDEPVTQEEESSSDEKEVSVKGETEKEEDGFFNPADLFKKMNNEIAIERTLTPADQLARPNWEHAYLNPTDHDLTQGFILSADVDMTDYNKSAWGIIGFTRTNESGEIANLTTTINGRTGFDGAEYTLLFSVAGQELSLYLYKAGNGVPLSSGKVTLSASSKTTPFRIHLSVNHDQSAPLFSLKTAPQPLDPEEETVWSTRAVDWSYRSDEVVSGFNKLGVNAWNSKMTLSYITIRSLPESVVKESDEEVVTEQAEADLLTSIRTTIPEGKGASLINWSGPLNRPLNLTGGGSIQTKVAFNEPGAEAVIALTSDDRSLEYKAAPYRLIIKPAQDSSQARVYLVKPKQNEFDTTQASGTLLTPDVLTNLLPVEGELADERVLWVLYRSFDTHREFFLGFESEVAPENAVWSYTQDLSQAQSTPAPLTQFGIGSLNTELLFQDITITGIERVESTKQTFIKADSAKGMIWKHELLDTQLDPEGGGILDATVAFGSLGKQAIIGLTHDQNTAGYRVIINPITKNRALITLERGDIKNIGGKYVSIDTSTFGDFLTKNKRIWVSYAQRGTTRVFRVFIGTPPVPSPARNDDESLDDYITRANEFSTHLWEYTEDISSTSPQPPTHFGIGTSMESLVYQNISVTPQQLSDADRAIIEQQEQAALRRSLVEEQHELDENDFPTTWSSKRYIIKRQGTRYTFTAAGPDEEDRVVLAFSPNRSGTDVAFRIILSGDGTAISDAVGPYIGDAAESDASDSVRSMSSIGLSKVPTKYWIELTPGTIRIGEIYKNSDGNEVADDDYLSWSHEMLKTTSQWHFTAGGTKDTTLVIDRGRYINSTNKTITVNRNTDTRTSVSDIQSRFGARFG